MEKSKADGKIEGEGSYSATADYNKRTADFLKKGNVDSAAREAMRALDSEEAGALDTAEAKGKAGDPKGQGKAKTK
ncbi:MAG: hypothetical protein EPO10_01375 [Reyranella sp.]|uniref:hypothetical protein n=1 Tax=Reyranella sp. TaxID=1929291 RepID=UPI001229810C|nr:hypothetical protein [Reyranella sp.]TAJ88729.1 MAG: hypothetical protein EPO41_20150 [Reyranella sp.]TBR30735.1 MAG: hypothetical protein EPO10_01375 [Reyranella sp.]